MSSSLSFFFLPSFPSHGRSVVRAPARRSTVLGLEKKRATVRPPETREREREEREERQRKRERKREEREKVELNKKTRWIDA